MEEPNLHFLDLMDARWLDFMQRQPDANIFHHPAWTRMLATCYGFRTFALTLCASNGDIRAGIPIAESNRLLSGRRWTALPFSDHCSPLANDAESARGLMQSIRALANTRGAPRVEVRWPEESESARQAPASFVLHTMRLDAGMENVAARVHHSHLRNVRIAQSHAVEIKRGIDRNAMEEFYNLHLKTRHKQGVPVQPKCYFQLLDELILQKGLGFILLAYHEQKCLAGAVFLHWNWTLTYKYGASDESGLSVRPNHLIFWNAIQWGCANGYSLLDFGRSDMDNPGLRTFKNRWGASETPLCYTEFPPVTHPHRSAGIFKNIVQTVIRNTPLEVCKLGGQLYYRYLS